jgi:hypothetical protein
MAALIFRTLMLMRLQRNDNFAAGQKIEYPRLENAVSLDLSHHKGEQECLNRH